MRSPQQRYEDRIERIKQRRDYLLDKKIPEREEAGRPVSYLKAEASALDWALAVIQSHYGDAVDLIIEEQKNKGKEAPDVR